MSDTEIERLTTQIAREEARLREIEAEQAAARKRLKALSAKLEMLQQPDPGAPVSPQSNDQKVRVVVYLKDDETQTTQTHQRLMILAGKVRAFRDVDDTVGLQRDLRNSWEREWDQ